MPHRQNRLFKYHYTAPFIYSCYFRNRQDDDEQNTQISSIVMMTIASCKKSHHRRYDDWQKTER